MRTNSHAWKKSVTPFQEILVATHGSRWHSKIKRSDFIWDGARPIALADSVKQAARDDMVKLMKTAMTLKEADKQRKTGDHLRVVVKINTGESDVHTLSLPIRSARDRVYLDTLLRIDERSLKGTQSARNERQFNIFTVSAWIRKVTGWKAESRTRENWFVEVDKTRAYIIPKNAPVSGPAHDHPVSNCAIEVIIKSIEGSMVSDATLRKLRTTYKTSGVWPDDYAIIAQLLGCQIKATFAPCSSVAHQWIDGGLRRYEDIFVTYGAASKKSINIHHWNNHATALSETVDKTYVVVDEAQMVEAIATRANAIHQVGEYHTAFRSELDGTIEVLQLGEAEGVTLDVGVTSPQVQLYDAYAGQIVPFGYNSPNIVAYDSFVKHGIHWSNGQERKDDFDFDLKSAYSSFTTVNGYRGLPQDITFWVNDPSIDDIRERTGFVLVDFIDPIKRINLVQWVSCPAVEFLFKHGYVRELIQAAYAHRTFELDTSAFIQPGVIGKRVAHKIIGLSTTTTSKRTFLSRDFIDLSAHHASKLKLPKHLSDAYPYLNDVVDGYYTIRVEYPNTDDRVSHVAAAIQDYVTLEVWHKWVELKQLNPEAQIVTALVDGIRVSSQGFDLATFNDNGGRWVRKESKTPCTSSQCDWLAAAPKAILAGQMLIKVDYPIAIKPEYLPLVNTDYRQRGVGDGSFAAMVKENWIHCIQGYAGTGKTWSIRGLVEQGHAIVLTPTHSTREDMSGHSIRSYLNDPDLNRIHCRTFQSVIQRPGILNDYQIIFVDEISMLLASDLNRLIQVAGRKLIILVGDPAQHQPITSKPMHLEAKSIVFKEHINASEKLKTAYDDQSDNWARTQMLKSLTYDCDFVAPEIDDIDSGTFEDVSEYKDRVDELRATHMFNKRCQVQQLRGILSGTFNYVLDSDVGAFDIFTGGKFLNVVKRADESADGAALVDFSSSVREESFDAVVKLCESDPTYYVEPNSVEIASDVTNTVVAYRNEEVDKYNNAFRETLLSMSDRPKSEALQRKLNSMLESGVESIQIEVEAKLPYAYVDVDIAVVARKTMRYKGEDGEVVTVYNGTRGVIRNFIIEWHGLSNAPMPLVETIQVKPTDDDPVPDDHVKVAAINPLYAITSYRAQGRTMGEGLIYIDCTYYSDEMLYVAVTRAKRLSQLRFIFHKEKENYQRSAYHHSGLVPMKNSRSLGFTATVADTIMTYPDYYSKEALTLDWSNVDWFAVAEEISLLSNDLELSPYAYSNFVRSYMRRYMTTLLSDKENAERHHAADRANHYDDGKLPKVLNATVFDAELYRMPTRQVVTQHTADRIETKPAAKMWSREDRYLFNALAREFQQHCAGPFYNTARPSKVAIGHDIWTYDFCVRVEYNGLRAFYWFIGCDDMLAFNEQHTSEYKNLEVHEVIVEKSCGYFIDLDYKISNEDLANYFGSLAHANEAIAAMLKFGVATAAPEHGWNGDVKTCVSQRSRQLDSNYSKVSLHVYTNLVATFDECKLLTNAIKQLVADKAKWATDMISGIDYAPYHLNGSLAMPGGHKNGIKSTMLSSDYVPLLSVCDGVDRVVYTDGPDDESDSDDDRYDSDDDEPTHTHKRNYTKSALMSELLNTIDQCDYFSDQQMYRELSWTTKDGKTGLVARKTSGHCNCCGGYHDVDNTLKVFITRNNSYGAVCSRGGSPVYWR